MGKLGIRMNATTLRPFSWTALPALALFMLVRAPTYTGWIGVSGAEASISATLPIRWRWLTNFRP